MSELDGLFKQKYPDLNGKDWVNQLTEEDKQVFVWNWKRSREFGRLGGLARASTAKRDNRGRFAPNAT